MASLKDDWQCDKNYVELMAILLANLKNSMEKTDTKYDALQEFHDLICAPDTNCRLWPTSELATENVDFTSEVEIKTLHKDIPLSVGEALGVKTKELKCFENISVGISFGQHEKLVTRIKGLLKAYPCDASIMKELLQNADDAGATEIHFVKDYRNHITDRLFGKSCEPLQGPALCVYNNSYFTREDLEGIHNLGHGSKNDDPNKTGQYGVGFNAVYHLTDTPTFLSKGISESDSYLLILDPLCEYVPKSTVVEPGQLCQLTDVQNNFPDHLLGFSQDKLFTGEVGTIFRFPLRTKLSEIGSEIIHTSHMDSTLNSFKDIMQEAVLFLKNVKCIKISNITTGDLEEEFAVNAQLSDDASEKRKQFNDKVNAITTYNKVNKERNLESDLQTVLYPLTVVDSNDRSVDWLIAQQFGSMAATSRTEELKQRIKDKDLGLLPIGGVAIPIRDSLLTAEDENQKTRIRTSQLPVKSSPPVNLVQRFGPSYQTTFYKTTDFSKDQKDYKANQTIGKVFCFLPLPVSTGLPVHVNGHLALDHESRRELWKDGYKMDWNTFILEYIVVPSWIAGLLHIRQKVQTDVGTANTWNNVNESIRKFHGLFPLHSNAMSHLWKRVVTVFYSHIFRHEAALFPYVQELRSNVCLKTEVTDNIFCLKWTHLTSAANSDLEGVFNVLNALMQSYCAVPLDRNKASHLIGRLLKSFGMKLLETPRKIFEEFHKADIENVPLSSPGLVIAFLKSSGCNAGPVNVDISSSKFLTANNLYEFIRFISKDESFADRTENLPVLLTEDGTLRRFNTEDPVFISKFSKLLPKSSCHFVHSRMMSLFIDEKFLESGVCKEFVLDEFVKLLPHSVESSVYAVGSENHWIVRAEHHPGLVSQEWLCLLFDFLYDQSRLKDEDKDSQVKQSHGLALKDTSEIVDTQHEFRSNISKLQEWSFFPCIKHQKMDQLLIPIREASHLLYIPYYQTLDALGSAFRKLGLPTIDMTALSKCSEIVCKSVIELVPSLDSPADILECLVYHKGKISKCSAITIQDASEIMAYFGRKLPMLQKSTKQHVVAQNLRELPFFITLQGTLTSIDNDRDVLVIPRNMPYHGIHEWAISSNIILLQERDSFDALYEVLGFHKADIEFVYGERILPEINKMPTQYWIDHITFLRDQLGHDMSSTPAKTKIKVELETIAFVNVRGIMKTVGELFDPDNKVFKCMKDASDFPPTNFKTTKWQYFLKQLGLICNVSDEMIIDFACQIELEGRSMSSSTVHLKSKTILNRFLEEHATKWQPTTLNKIKSIRFIKPYVVEMQRIRIVPQHGNANALISFEESTCSSFTSLCWTSIDLLPEKTYQKINADVRNMLGIHDEPPLDKVILHCQNICDALKPLIKASPISRKFVEDQMTSIYEYLTNHIHSNRNIQHRLQYTYFVHLPDENDLVLAKEVVIDLASESEIKPYMYQAPKFYGRYHNLFQALGSKHKIMLSHYANILKSIKEKCKDSELMPFEKGVTQKTVEGLLRLDLNSDRSTHEVRHIYLPNQDLHLLKSTELTIPNNYWFKERLCNHVHINYFVGLLFLKLTEKDMNLQEIFSKWPAHLKPIFLSEVVDEAICLNNEERGMQSQKTVTIEKFLHSQEFKSTFGGIMQQQFSTEGMFYEETLVLETNGSLHNVRVYELPRLQSVLKYQGNVVDGSVMSIPHYVKIDQQYESKQIIFYFTDSTETNDVDISQILDGLFDVIKLCAPNINVMSTARVMTLLQHIDSPDKLPEILKRLQIKPFTSGQVLRKDYFPKPGTYVEPKFIPFLEQGMEPFKDYEYDNVAMELTDSKNEIYDDDDAVQVYIYVKILQESSSSTLSGDLGKVYSVTTGNPDVFSEQVPIFRLYRFVRRGEDPGTDLQKYYARPSNSQPFDEQCLRIREDVNEAWKLPEVDRKRVLRRIILKWHPDKNRGNEDYCKKVFQYIKIAISRLENAEDLSENVDAEMSQGPSYSSQSSSRYYDNVHRRAHGYARAFYDNYEEYSRCERTGSYSHCDAQNNSRPDTYEAKRWMRQAKSDLKAGETMLPVANDVDAYNWICYLCHQACEKALKSAKYAKDANDVPKGSKSHYLTLLTPEPAILEQVQKLEARIGDHARLRYPDAVSRPRVPSDIYSKEDAQFAIDVARKVISRVDDDIS